MTSADDISPTAAKWVDPVMSLSGLLSIALVLVLTHSLASDLRESMTRNTVRLSLSWYTAALLLMMRLGTADWRAATTLGKIARWCWTWGIASFLVHLAMAFHYYHHWSHAHAFEHTRQIAGTGEGIYVSYLFTWLWIGDAAWWWIQPERYAARAAWIGRALHTFMLFIVFNGMVVFENGPIRWAGLILIMVLLIARLMARGPAKPRLT